MTGPLWGSLRLSCYWLVHLSPLEMQGHSPSCGSCLLTKISFVVSQEDGKEGGVERVTDRKEREEGC